jgi:hypothetical protein
MTDQETQILKREIIITAAYYQLKLDPQVIPMYAEDLRDLPLSEVLQAYKIWRRNPKHFRFPLPGQIRNIVRPEVNPENEAREAASRIVSAMTKFGYSNSNQAKLYMGSIAWRVVELQGGWSHLCQTVMTDELPIYQAQWRQLAETVYYKYEQGRESEIPQLPGSKNSLEESIGWTKEDSLAILQELKND